MPIRLCLEVRAAPRASWGAVVASFGIATIEKATGTLLLGVWVGSVTATADTALIKDAATRETASNRRRLCPPPVPYAYPALQPDKKSTRSGTSAR